MAIPKKPRTCRVCRQVFQPHKIMQTVCGPDCAIKQAQAKRTKAERIQGLEDRKVIKAKLESLKTRADWLREAERAVNAYVRARDAGIPCISCGRMHEGQWHAGHYRSKGSAPHLRFDAERNIFRQCAPCNTYLSGNLINYRAGLIAKIGLQAVEELEADQEPRKYSIAELKEIKAHYIAKLKQLRGLQ